MGACLSQPNVSAERSGEKFDKGFPSVSGQRRYEVLQTIGVASCGKIHLAEDHLDGGVVALWLVSAEEVVQEDGQPNKQLLNEVLNHRLCYSHPQIVQFKEVYATDNNELAIAMEHISTSALTLKDYVAQRGKLSEDDARAFFQQLIFGLDFCHKKGILCRDLKLENIVVDAGMHGKKPLLQIREFGASKREEVTEEKDGKLQTLVGTPEYVAPEVLTEPSLANPARDIWSAGVILYVMLTGTFPFTSPTERLDRNRLKKLLKGAYEAPGGTSALCRDLLSQMFQPNPSQRMTTDRIMGHPWYKYNIPKVVEGYNRRLLEACSEMPQSERDIDNVFRTVVKSLTH